MSNGLLIEIVHMVPSICTKYPGMYLGIHIGCPYRNVQWTSDGDSPYDVHYMSEVSMDVSWISIRCPNRYVQWTSNRDTSYGVHFVSSVEMFSRNKI